jgi:hypothetical protein
MTLLLIAWMRDGSMYFLVFFYAAFSDLSIDIRPLIPRFGVARLSDLVAGG